MRFKFVKTLIVSSALTAALAVGAAADFEVGTITATALNFRAEASASSAILSVVPNGSTVNIVEAVNDEWYKVFYNGSEGYMSAEYLSITAISEDVSIPAVVNATDVRIRSEANTECSVLGFCNPGNKVTITGSEGDWYKIDFNGISGYMRSDFLKLYSSAEAEASSGIGQTLVNYALQFLGTPYVYGGTSTSGFDCSGLIYYTYTNNGYSITRRASTQYNDGTHITKAELQVGDLVFFSSDYSSSIEHVGMYIGDGQFVHASSGGGCVKINNLSDSYYTNNYYGACRISY